MSADSTNKPLLEIVKNTKKPTGTKTGSTGGSGGNGSSKTQKFGEYIIKNGAFHQVRPVKASPDGSSGIIEFPLCDFTCRIVEEVTADDGLTDTTFLRIEGRRADGALLPVVDVPAKSFYASQGN